MILIFFWMVVQAGFSQSYQLMNAKLWNGQFFEQKDLYIQDGIFRETIPPQLDSTIDLSGKFIVPPFGDFHTHLFDGEYSTRHDSLFRAQGIHFAHDLVNDPRGRDMMAAYFEQSHTLDVAYANGCITANYGHPIEGYERMEYNFGWRLTEAEKHTLRESRIYENRTYYTADNPRQLQEKLSLLLATQPDAIKVILFHSEDYNSRGDSTIQHKGLNPALLSLVKAAGDLHQLRVIAHVESADDLTVALRAGIIYFAHLPDYGYGNNGKLDEVPPVLADSTFQWMKAANARVSPTLYRTFANLEYLPKEYRPDSGVYQGIKKFHAALLRKLKAYGVNILAGSDFTNTTAVDEICYYGELNVFEPAELLNILIDTSKEIFPQRKIGALAPGFEANCLVLNADPTSDIKHIREIAMSMKKGIIAR